MSGRSLKQIEQMQFGQVLALDDSGLLWFGQLKVLDPDEEDRVIEWQPIKGPPDGVHYSEAKLSFWDKMEKDARAIAKRTTDTSGEAVSLETSERSDASRAIEAVQASPDDDLEDGEGEDRDQ